jgi:hypothetical protein
VYIPGTTTSNLTSITVSRAHGFEFFELALESVAVVQHSSIAAVNTISDHSCRDRFVTRRGMLIEPTQNFEDVLKMNNPLIIRFVITSNPDDRTASGI